VVSAPLAVLGLWFNSIPFVVELSIWPLLLVWWICKQ